MFRKNKKIVKFLIGALILSLPATLKVSAMENNPENLGTTVETTQKEFDFSDDEEFNLNFEYHLKYLLKTTFIEDLRQLALYKTYGEIWKLGKIFDEIIIKFRKENRKFIEQNIKNGKNKKVNFYYYEYLLFCLYDHLIFPTLYFFRYEIINYFEKKEFCKKIIESVIKHKDYIFEEISELIKEQIHKTGNEKFYNIPEKYASFEEYIKKENLEKPYKIYTYDNVYMPDYDESNENNMFIKFDNLIDLNKITIIIENTLNETFQNLA